MTTRKTARIDLPSFYKGLLTVSARGEFDYANQLRDLIDCEVANFNKHLNDKIRKNIQEHARLAFEKAKKDGIEDPSVLNLMGGALDTAIYIFLTETRELVSIDEQNSWFKALGDELLGTSPSFPKYFDSNSKPKDMARDWISALCINWELSKGQSRPTKKPPTFESTILGRWLKVAWSR